MITKKQLRIFNAFVEQPFIEHTRNDIKLKAKEKSNNMLNKTIDILKKENVILEKKIGRSGLLSLNLNNSLTNKYISLNNELLLNPLIKKVLNQIKSDFLEVTPFFSLVVFGSYAKNKQNTNSDLDIALFLDSPKDQKRIQTLFNTNNFKYALDVDLQIILRKEMLMMLKNKEENLGKQIVRNHLAIYNVNIFYEILKEGFENGFKL